MNVMADQSVKRSRRAPRQREADPEQVTRGFTPTLSLREVLGKAIERLPRQERLVMTLYYYEKLTMREIASILLVTESRLCQIHSKAVRALKTQLQSAA